MRRFLGALLVGTAICSTLACANVRQALYLPGGGTNPVPNSPRSARPWRPYPAQAELGADLDIVVSQAAGVVHLVNRTPKSYRNVQLWLNDQYGAKVTVEIGPGNRFALTRFINEHAEHFPIAGILTPDKGFPILSCILFDPATGKRHRLLARQ
jgi:hypothetical protein